MLDILCHTFHKRPLSVQLLLSKSNSVTCYAEAAAPIVVVGRRFPLLSPLFCCLAGCGGCCSSSDKARWALRPSSFRDCLSSSAFFLTDIMHLHMPTAHCFMITS